MPHHARSVTAGVAAAAALLAALAPGGPAAGEPLEHVHESVTTSEDLVDFCGVEGLVVHLEESVSEHRLVVERGPNGLAWFHARFQEVQVFTNLTTGSSVTIERGVNDRDARLTSNDDGTYVYTETISGPSKVTGPNGERLLLDAGLVSWQLLLDADLQPVDFLGVRLDAGRRDTTGRDFCADFLEWTA